MTGPSPDFVIIGSGIGGATIAYGLAPSGADVLILERGDWLRDSPQARDLGAIFARGHFRSGEMWHDAHGEAFPPGNFYYVGGNSKFYGAVMYRYRAQDFGVRQHLDGETVAWPFGYEELEPWYGGAEALFAVRGAADGDPTEPPRSTPFPHPPVPHEPQIADAAERLSALGLHPAPLPLAVDVDAWLARAGTPWDGVPDTRSGKIDAETGPLVAALAHPNVRIETGATVERLIVQPDGRRIGAVEYRQDGALRRVSAATVILSAGAVQSAALLLRSDRRSGPGGVANSSGAVGRYFMNHNTTAMIALDPRRRFETVHSKTLGLNDFYLDDGEGGPPLGNVQLLGKISAPILAANLPLPAPQPLLRALCARSLDWYLMSEDIPSATSRVTTDGARIVLDWRPTNLRAHARLVTRMRRIFRAAGYPLIVTKPFGNRAPSHQCGTVRMGLDPAAAPLDPDCRSYDHPNLYVVDASFLPSSAAVNPSLTIAAQALRVADRLQPGRGAVPAATQLSPCAPRSDPSGRG